MAITDLSVVSSLRAKLQWHQARQKVLSENVANATTPRFKPHDLVAPSAAATRPVSLERTDPLHLSSTGSTSDAASRDARRFETRPSGNAVNLEDEMLKVAENQSDYQLAASLYQKSLALLRSAAGVRGG